MVMASDEEQQQQRFHQILLAFASTENEARAAAEAEYDAIPPENKILFLLAHLRIDGIEDDVRLQCAVLLRRVFLDHFDTAWPKMPEPTREQTKNEIIGFVTRDTYSPIIRKKLCEMCAEFIRVQIDEDGNNQWPQFLQYLFQMINAPSTALKENALIIFGLVPTIFGQKQEEYVDIIKEMLKGSFLCDAATVRYEAADALASFVLEHMGEEQLLKHCGDLVPDFLKVLQETVATHNDSLFKLAVEIMSEAPKFFRAHLGDILGFCLQIGNMKEEEYADVKQLAVEFCITACETVPGAVKKLGTQFVECLVQLLMGMMAEVDFDNTAEEWAAEEWALEEDSDSSPAIAEAGLDRLACGLGGKAVLPVVMAQVTIFLGSPEWNRRYAGLMAVSAIGEGCVKQMEPYLPQIIDPIINFLKDPDPRVRYAACNALGQMATDFAPNYEKKYHSKILPALTVTLEADSCARVQGHAGAALVNFCEDCPKDILKNYAQVLVAKLEACFKQKLEILNADYTKNLVIEQLLTTLASIANTLEEEFAVYYEAFMPSLKMIIQHANHESLSLLRGKAIECVSLIGVAVGAERFTADAAEIMNLLLASQVEGSGVQIADDDPQLSYMITAWGRICQILGESFAPYLPMVMGPIMKTAALKPDMQVLDGESDAEDDWEVIKLNDDQALGIHTARLDDKSMACQMLVCYARVLKTHFRPYVDEVAKIVHPLCKFVFMDSVRSAAAEIIPYLLKCLDGDPNAQVLLWNYLKGELFSATENEIEPDVKAEQLYALSCCIEILPREALDQETILKLNNLVETTFEEHFARCDERLATKEDEDYDEVVEDQLHAEMEEDNYLLTKAADIIHSFLKVLKLDYLPFFEQKLITYVHRLLQPDRHWQERQWGICVWDDLVEYTGAAAAKYQEGFVGSVLNGLVDSSPEVRQAAAYGCGVMAQYAGDIFGETCKQAWPLIVRIVSAPDSRIEENNVATENAISAAGRIIKFTPNAVNPNEAIPIWLSWLPILEDKDEVLVVYQYFCELLESNNPAALGNQGYENLPMILKIIAEVVQKKVLPDDSPLIPRLCQIVKAVQSNPQLYQSCISHLPPEYQQILNF